MITLDDMEDMCSLTREEIAQLADHEHITLEAAVAEAEALMHAHGGPQHVHAMLCEDIRSALHADDTAGAKRLFAILRGFVTAHPEGPCAGRSDGSAPAQRPQQRRGRSRPRRSSPATAPP